MIEILNHFIIKACMSEPNYFVHLDARFCTIYLLLYFKMMNLFTLLQVWKVPTPAREKVLVISPLFYFQDIPIAKFEITQLTWFIFFAIICIITSSVPKPTFTQGCEPKRPNSSKFSTEPNWIRTRRPSICPEVVPQLPANYR